MTEITKIIIALVAAVVLAGAYYAWRHSLIGQGETAIKNQDAVASVDLLAQAHKETDDLRTVAANAAKVAFDEHRKYEDYVAAYPLPAIRVCVSPPNNRHPGLPEPSAVIGGAAHPSAGLSAGGPVPAGRLVATSNDVGPSLTVIVSSFATVVGLYRECQSRLESPTVGVQ